MPGTGFPFISRSPVRINLRNKASVLILTSPCLCRISWKSSHHLRPSTPLSEKTESLKNIQSSWKSRYIRSSTIMLGVITRKLRASWMVLENGIIHRLDNSRALGGTSQLLLDSPLISLLTGKGLKGVFGGRRAFHDFLRPIKHSLFNLCSRKFLRNVNPVFWML